MQPDTWLAHRHSADPSREERRTPPFLQPDPSQYLPLPSLSERSTGGWFGGSNWWARRTDLERTVEAQAAELAALRSKVCKLEGVARSPLPPPPPLASAYTNTKPQLLPKRPLDRIEGLIDERIRTLCLVGVLCAVVYFALYHLAGTLIPFFLAVSLKYILTPLIDVLSCRHPLCESGRPRPWWLVELPRKWAVLFALAIALFVLFVVGLTVANSLSAFASRAGVYNERIDELIDWFFHKLTEVQIDLGVINATDHSGERQIENIDLLKNAVVEKIDASELIISFLGTATSVLENVIYASPHTPPWGLTGTFSEPSCRCSMSCSSSSLCSSKATTGETAASLAPSGTQSARSSPTLAARFCSRSLWASPTPPSSATPASTSPSPSSLARRPSWGEKHLPGRRPRHVPPRCRPDDLLAQLHPRRRRADRSAAADALHRPRHGAACP